MTLAPVINLHLSQGFAAMPPPPEQVIRRKQKESIDILAIGLLVSLAESFGSATIPQKVS